MEVPFADNTGTKMEIQFLERLLHKINIYFQIKLNFIYIDLYKTYFKL